MNSFFKRILFQENTVSREYCFNKILVSIEYCFNRILFSNEYFSKECFLPEENMTFYENALFLKLQLERQISRIEKRLPLYPDGQLHFQKSKNKLYPYQESGQRKLGNRKRKYLSDDHRDVAELLARKYYDELCLADLKRELTAVKAYLKESSGKEKELDRINSRWDLYAPYLKNNKPAIISAEEEAFINEDWTQSKEYPEHLTVKVSDSACVRSKSESQIWIAAEKRGIPFKYERVTNIGGISMAPDFTFFNRKLNRPMIWEHFGMMDRPEYNLNARKKLDTYLRAGFLPNRDVIFTFETSDDPFTLEKAEKIFRDLFD